MSKADKTKEYIIESSYSHEYGARPIKRFIQREIETMIAKAIISGDIKENQKYLIDEVNNSLVIKTQ